jgi:putative DNA primase/helicase
MHDVKELALRLHRNGFVPLCIDPQSKACRAPGWSKTTPTAESIDRTFSRPGGIGVRLGDLHQDGTCLIAIDIDLEEHQLIRAVERALGVRVPVKRGKKGYTYIFLLDEEHPTQKLYWSRHGGKKAAIDILCRGAQTVLPPTIHPETKRPYYWVSGTPLDQIERSNLPIFSRAVIDEVRGFCRDADDPIHALNDMEWRGVGGGGNTHDTCVAAVGSMVARGWSDEEIHGRVERAKREACELAGASYDWNKSTDVIQEWINSARAKDFGAGARAKSNKPIHGVLADEVLLLHGDLIRFDRDREEWYGYDGTRWIPKQVHRVRNLIGQKFLPDPMRTKGVIDGILSSLRDRPELSMTQDDWDRKRHLLNTPCGTIDLRTSEIRPHSSTDFITKCTRVSPAPEADVSFFIEKLTDWVGDLDDEKKYHQRLFGYFLTGETRDPCLAIWHGPGGDGKSKFAGILEWIMGDYAQTATETAFLETRNPQHSEEIACLRGARLVLSGEASGKWNESRIKSITGGDRLTGSFKFKPVFTYTPEFKPLITTNEPPRLVSTGKDIARRLHVYPFPRTIQNPDTRLMEKLQEIGDGILWWGILGAAEYYKEGLLRSSVVEAANAEYLFEHDVLQQFLDDCVVKDASARVRTLEVLQALNQYATARGHAEISQTTLTKRLRAKGVECRTAQLERGKNSQRAYYGIRLGPEAEDDYRY